MNHNEIETTSIQTLGVRGRVQQRDDTEINRASPYPDIRFGEELGAEESGSGFMIARKLLRRRHILKERRERREAFERDERMRKRQLEESGMKDTAKRLKVEIDDENLIGDCDDASSDRRQRMSIPLLCREWSAISDPSRIK